MKELCVQLLEKLSRVAESPYGQGVIAHMLLRGDNRDVMAGSLGLILLEKYERRIYTNESIVHCTSMHRCDSIIA